MTPDAALPARRSRRSPTLAPPFYDRPTELVARDLLGAILECTTAEGTTSGRIVETEAYLGDHDPACHAVAGRTPRTWNLFGPPATAYVYRIYGMHWCFNAVTQREGIGSAVLVRALEPLEGVDLMRPRRPSAKRDEQLCDGPGKLCAALGITGAHDGLLLDHGALVIREGTPVEDDEVVASPRIGITRAADWPLRCFLRGSRAVSRTPRDFPVTPYSR